MLKYIRYGLGGTNLREHVFVMPVDQVEIVPSKLGNNAGMVGVTCWSAKQS